MNQGCISSFLSLQGVTNMEKMFPISTFALLRDCNGHLFPPQAVETCKATKVITAQFHLFSLLKGHIKEKYTRIPFKFNFLSYF